MSRALTGTEIKSNALLEHCLCNVKAVLCYIWTVVGK